MRFHPVLGYSRMHKGIDFAVPESYRTTYKKVLNQTTRLVDCPQFTTQILAFDKALRKDYSELDSFVIYVCVEGALKVECGSSLEPLKKGEALLIPAIAGNVVLHPSEECRILETYIS